MLKKDFTRNFKKQINMKNMFKNLKKGSVLSEAQFYTVKSILRNEAILLTDGGDEITVPDSYVDELLNSADYAEKEQKITRTEAAEMLIANANVAMTVNYNTKVKSEDVEKEIMEAYSTSTPAELPKAIKKAVKGAIEGKERTIIGRHSGGVNEFGRLNFVDMELQKELGKTYDSRLRQVDPRTINYLILRGTKYVVK